MSNKLRFYSSEEYSTLEKAILDGTANSNFCIKFAKKYKRNVSAVTQKVNIMKRTLKINKKRPAKNATSLVKGMKLEFKASHIVLEENRLIIYI